ncbi:MAG: PhzF family phenazine biosynthesis protein [Thermoplasmata archaeon]|nr:MAG: PhzF family phenazine biosynthesis protein [Thermoplasmata archaeon]
MGTRVIVEKVNAFTDSLDGGNPAGVVLNSPLDLSDEQMIFITRSLEVSETAFVFSTHDEKFFRVRFFTPEIEVDLCGHATIATFFTMASKGFFPTDKKLFDVNQETKAGLLPVTVEFGDNGTVNRVMMTQRKPVFRDIYLDISKIADSLNIKTDEINVSLPLQRVSTGLFTLPVCVESFDVLRGMKPDFEKIKKICNEIDVGSFHVFTFDTLEQNSLYHARNFAPVYGVNEDPVTGTANGAVCSYLVKNKIIKKGKFNCEQGDIINRKGRVMVEIDENNMVKVGGRARIVLEKEIML